MLSVGNKPLSQKAILAPLLASLAGCSVPELREQDLSDRTTLSVGVLETKSEFLQRQEISIQNLSQYGRSSLHRMNRLEVLADNAGILSIQIESPGASEGSLVLTATPKNAKSGYELPGHYRIASTRTELGTYRTELVMTEFDTILFAAKISIVEEYDPFANSQWMWASDRTQLQRYHMALQFLPSKLGATLGAPMLDSGAAIPVPISSQGEFSFDSHWVQNLKQFGAIEDKEVETLQKSLEASGAISGTLSFTSQLTPTPPIGVELSPNELANLAGRPPCAMLHYPSSGSAPTPLVWCTDKFAVVRHCDRTASPPVEFAKLMDQTDDLWALPLASLATHPWWITQLPTPRPLYFDSDSPRHFETDRPMKYLGFREQAKIESFCRGLQWAESAMGAMPGSLSLGESSNFTAIGDPNAARVFLPPLLDYERGFNQAQTELSGRLRGVQTLLESRFHIDNNHRSLFEFEEAKDFGQQMLKLIATVEPDADFFDSVTFESSDRGKFGGGLATITALLDKSELIPALLGLPAPCRSRLIFEVETFQHLEQNAREMGWEPSPSAADLARVYQALKNHESKEDREDFHCKLADREAMLNRSREVRFLQNSSSPLEETIFQLFKDIESHSAGGKDSLK
ncbi:MAG: hypothetical protein KDD70_09160 [Bdellovibrionales bacterium]|nr:hypothetical protein [Bdellovibrionales bacterium]